MRSGLLGALMLAALALATAADATTPMGPAIGGKWRIDSILGTGAFDAARTSFEVLPTGRVATTIGCNRMIGKPKFDMRSIRFGRMLSTMMACPLRLAKVERAYAAALRAARSYAVDGDTLTLFDAKSEALVRMSRAP